MKLTEEIREVADAFLGVHGLNRRKGICKSQDDLLDELADVIITAAVAMNGITGDAGGLLRVVAVAVGGLQPVPVQAGQEPGALAGGPGGACTARLITACRMSA